MLLSEGRAVMYGGGFSEMLLYSRVNCDWNGQREILSLSDPARADSVQGESLIEIRRTLLCAARLAMMKWILACSE